jgi:hypothetical protein
MLVVWNGPNCMRMVVCVGDLVPVCGSREFGFCGFWGLSGMAMGGEGVDL